MRNIKVLGSVVVILALVMLVTPLTASIVTAPKYGPTLDDLPTYAGYTYVEYRRATEDELNRCVDEICLNLVYRENGQFYEKKPQPHVPYPTNGVLICEYTKDSEAKKAYEVFYEEKESVSDDNPLAIDIGDEGVSCDRYYGSHYQKLILFRTGRFVVRVLMDTLCEDVARITEQNIKKATASVTPKPSPTPPPIARPTPRPTPRLATPAAPTPTLLPVLSVTPNHLYIIPIALFLILLPLIFYIRGKKKEKPATTPEMPPEQEPAIKKEMPPPISESLTIERAIYDPCKRDFIESALPRMKEWINSHDPGTYWFATSIQNNTDKTIEGWGVELGFSSALKIEEAKIEGIEIETPHEAHLGLFKISVPKEYGIVIPKGGTQRVYFKLRADKPKTTYEISGVFKSAITGDVPIRAKEFKYLCDTDVSPEAVKVELKKIFSEKDAARLALSFKTVQELDRMCNQEAKTEEYQDKLSVLRNYTEGFSNNFTKHVNEFTMFMKEEQLEYLDDEYKGKVRRFCTNLVDVWISEFLKG